MPVTNMAICKIVSSFNILLCNYLVAKNQLPIIGICQNTKLLGVLFAMTPFYANEFLLNQ